MGNRIVDNLPPSGLGDELADIAIKTAYKDGARQALLCILDDLENKFMSHETRIASPEAAAILEVAKFLGEKAREHQRTIDGL